MVPLRWGRYRCCARVPAALACIVRRPTGADQWPGGAEPNWPSDLLLGQQLAL